MAEVHLLVEALVREYLHKSGFRSTLQAFDTENPRSSDCISDTKVLRAALGLADIARVLKRDQRSVPCCLELLARRATELQESASRSSDRKGDDAVLPRAGMPGRSRLDDIRARAQSGAQADPWVSMADGAGPDQPAAGTARAPGVQVVMDGFDDPAGARRAAASGAPTGPRHAARVTDRVGSRAPPAGAPAPFMRPHAPAQAPRGAVLGGDLQLEDVDDALDSFSLGPSQRSAAATMPQRRVPGAMPDAARARPPAMPDASPLAPEEVAGIRETVFGVSGGEPPASWVQGVYFCDRPTLRFGLEQQEGGPCGVLAALQAHLLAGMFDRDGRFDLDPSDETRRELLAAALSYVLWQAGSGRRATVVLSTAASTAGLSFPALLASARKVACPTRAALDAAVVQWMDQVMEPRGHGVVLVVMSAVLSRGLSALFRDMDDPSSGLSTRHNYCAQDLVNLLLVGKAVTNCFDGDRDLDGMALHGVGRQSRVGFLMLYEWYMNAEVGSFLKRPQCPVWVVCAESHYTVLFSDDRDRAIAGALPFSLWYYDQLARQDAAIRLTLSASPGGGHSARSGNTAEGRSASEAWGAPPLEFVIETRWPDAQVDWNGAEPIL